MTLSINEYDKKERKRTGEELPAKWGVNNERKTKIKCQGSHDTIRTFTNTYETYTRAMNE